MTLALVGTPVSAAVSNVSSTTLTKSVTAGNALVALIECSDGVAAIGTVSEGGTNFTNDFNAPLFGVEAQYAHRKNSATGGTSDVITLTMSASHSVTWILYEVSGMPASPYDSALSNTATASSGTTLAISSKTSAVLGELLFLIFGDSTAAWTVSSVSGGFTQDNIRTGFGAYHLITSGAGVASATLTTSIAMAQTNMTMVGYQPTSVASDPFPLAYNWQRTYPQQTVYRM